jgi:hypothetical protein
MTAMQPNSQLYVQSYRYLPSLCRQDEDEKPCVPNENTIYENIISDENLQKTAKIINKSGMVPRFRNKQGPYDNGITLFVCNDDRIPQEFVDDVTLFRARVFINSYTLVGTADIDYLVTNGTSLYTTQSGDNPLLCVVRQSMYAVGEEERRDTEITINNVGRIVREINCSNGNIIVLDNIGSVAYINGRY